MTEGEWKLIHGFAAMIEGAERKGAPIDLPEGARTVSFTLSDTMATRVTMAMRQAAGEIESLQETKAEQAEALESLRNQVNLITDPKIVIPRAR
jgi:hypothetical protein